MFQKVWIVSIRSFEEGRNQSGLPVMTMNDIRLESYVFSQSQCSMGKKNETLQVVVIVSRGFP